MGPVTVGLSGWWRPRFHRTHLPHIDFILLSHAHFDHFDLATLRGLERAGTSVVTAKITSDLLRVRRYQVVQELGWDERIRVGPLRSTGSSETLGRAHALRCPSRIQRLFDRDPAPSRRVRWRHGVDRFVSCGRSSARGSGDYAGGRVRSVDSRALQSRAGLADGSGLRRRICCPCIIRPSVSAASRIWNRWSASLRRPNRSIA